jgi:hypothetical protein
LNGVEMPAQDRTTGMSCALVGRTGDLQVVHSP